MIKELYKDPEIQLFLSIFPKESWEKCIYLTLIYGIRAIKRETSYSKLSLLESLVFPQNSSKRVKKNSNSSSNRTPKPESTSSTLPSEPKEKISSKRLVSPPSQKGPNKYKMPRYLKNIQSKIKDDVQKDLAFHRYEKESILSPKYRKKCNRSLPELLEVKEPDIFPIEQIDQSLGPSLFLMAEKFLTSPCVKVNSRGNN